MDPDIVVPLGFFAMVIIVSVVLGLPLARIYARKMENESKTAALPPEIAGRLERMEHAIDSIAVEVERISEGQRFTTKLLSEVHDAPALPAGRDRSSNVT